MYFTWMKLIDFQSYGLYFNNTTFIKDAAKRVNIKEAEAELAVKKWLKYAADRDGGRKKRAENQKRKCLAVS